LSVFDHHLATSSFPGWASKDSKRMFPNFSDSLIETDDIVYQNLPRFKNYKGKVLMLVGAGPSASTGWEDIEYDYLWTMNHFYKNAVFRDKVVDLAMMMGEPNIGDETFIEMRNKHNFCVGFEVHDKWKNSQFDDYKNYFCMHTRFYGRIGAGARMKIFAAHLGFKKVYFTGCDGPAAIFNGDHFFEPGKKTLPSAFTDMALKEVSKQWKFQYDYLWEYIKGINSAIEFENLGGGEIYHEKCR
jgi:hypothetical protein